MKCNAKRRLRMNAVEALQTDEVKKAIDEMELEIRERVKAHLIVQLSASIAWTLNQHYGFGRKRVQKFFANWYEDLDILEHPPIGTGIVCAEELVPWLRDRFGIDLSDIDTVERDARGNIVDKDKEITARLQRKKMIG